MKKDQQTINEQLSQTDVSGSVFKIMSGNSELERFRNEQKANEVCDWYKGKGFPNARVVETDR